MTWPSLERRRLREVLFAAFHLSCSPLNSLLLCNLSFYHLQSMLVAAVRITIQTAFLNDVLPSCSQFSKLVYAK